MQFMNSGPSRRTLAHIKIKYLNVRQRNEPVFCVISMLAFFIKKNKKGRNKKHSQKKQEQKQC